MYPWYRMYNDELTHIGKKLFILEYINKVIRVYKT